MDSFDKEGIRGIVQYVDQAADLPTMLAHVEGRIGHIIHESNALQFLLLKFTKPAPERDIMEAPDRKGWFPHFDRSKPGGANIWHIHAGVAIFVPEQKEAAVPTGITLEEHYQGTEKKLDMRNPGPKNPEELIRFNEAMPTLWSDEISESGHVLILPASVLHARKTVDERFTKAAGIIHRLMFKDI